MTNQHTPITVEELLKPRFKVSAEYPESPYKIGDIEHDETWSENDSLANYPAIFKRLEWWEDRKPEEMPEYVKYWDISLFFPVDRVCKTADAPFNSNNFTASNFLPATLAEYQQYINSKPQP